MYYIIKVYLRKSSTKSKEKHPVRECFWLISDRKWMVEWNFLKRKAFSAMLGRFL